MEAHITWIVHIATIITEVKHSPTYIRTHTVLIKSESVKFKPVKTDSNQFWLGYSEENHLTIHTKFEHFFSNRKKMKKIFITLSIQNSIKLYLILDTDFQCLVN